MNVKNNFNFICEQDGKSEMEFTNALLPIFITYNKPLRAYLVRVEYKNNTQDLNVALCLMTQQKEDEYLLHEAIKVFKSMFGREEHLDIIFLNEQQEQAIRKVSCPFFISSGYQVAAPDFYLISSEGYGLNRPLACFKRKRLYGMNPNGYLFCDIKPVLIGQHYGVSSKNIEQIILASRHQGYSLFQINEWPLYVHVAIPLLNNLESNNYINETDIKLIAWGELYRSESEAVKQTNINK